MMKRLAAALLALLCLWGTAQAGGNAAGKDGQLVPQSGEYSPRYSVSPNLTALPGKAFELVVYEDEGTLPLVAAGNGGSAPAGVSFGTREENGVRKACITGTVYAEGRYVFSLLVQEETDEEGTLRTLAILHVTLRITSDVPVIEPYLGDGVGMVRVIMDGVNFRRTPGGTRLGMYDEGDRFVWCSAQDKGGYTWYRVWSADFGYGYLRGDMLKEEPPLRLVYTPDRETAFPLFITPGGGEGLTPSLIMTENPEVIGFDTQPLVTVQRGADAWTLLCFTIPGEQRFWIQVDLRDAEGVPLECQLVYLTPVWEDAPPYENH